MPDDKKMLCLRFDDNNLEFSYLLGLSVLLPTIVLVYCLLKFLLQFLIHHPQHMSQPKKRETETVTNEKSDAEDKLDEAKGQQAVLYRFRQRQKKIQTEITSCSKLIAKEEESCVSKAPPRLRDGDLVHFSHRHPLLRFHLKGTEVIRCNMCTIIISGVAYGCDCCRYFLHEPKKREIEIVTDQAEDQLDEAKGQQAVLYRFRLRHKKIQTEITSCSKLIAKEEESCVSKTPPRLRDGDLAHFSHRHPLLRFHLKGTEVIRCNICTIIISGVAYGCDCCRYFLHEVCSNIPKRIRHDFHPTHSLTLLPIPSIALWHSKVESEFCCVACGYDNSLFSFYYHCDLCKFDLHLECASVTTKLIHKVKYPLDLFTSFPLKSEGAALLCCICNQVMNRQSAWLFYNREFDYICHFECAAEEELGVIGDQSFLSEVQKSLLLLKSFPDQQQKQGQLGEVTHFCHRHPLKAIKQTNEASIMSCCICSSQDFSGYICQLCNYFIDETCFSLPRRIQHHFHPNHPLILASYNDPPKSKCRACGHEEGVTYRCSTCKFSLHRTCAGAPMTFTLIKSKEVSYKLLYSYPYDGEMAVIKCSGCSKELNSKESFMYYNFDLDEVLHVQCALYRETDSYDTKFVLASERLKSIKIEEDHS